MSNTKVLISALFLSLLPYVSCQSEPNDTLYIPGISLIESEFGTPTAPVVISQETVQGASTVFQIVDALPTAAGGDLTATLELSPSGAHLSADAPMVGPVDITCSIAGDSSCQLEVGIAAGGATVSITSTFTEATSGVPVVAIGVSSGSGSGSSTPTATSDSSRGGTAVSTPGSSLSQTAGSSVTTGNSSPSSSSSGSQTAPAPAASTSQPSSAMGLRSSVVTILIGFSLVMASL